MDLLDRRKLLDTKPNPNPNFDYVSVFEVTLGQQVLGSEVEVVIRYVPDRLILTNSSFDTYLNAFGQTTWGSLEDIAVAVLDDIRNELVTRWLQVSLTLTPTGAEHLRRHGVMLLDYQPNWDNEELLSRLPPL